MPYLLLQIANFQGIFLKYSYGVTVISGNDENSNHSQSFCEILEIPTHQSFGYFYGPRDDYPESRH